MKDQASVDNDLSSNFLHLTEIRRTTSHLIEEEETYEGNYTVKFIEPENTN
jgi:hypothetical protein